MVLAVSVQTEMWRQVRNLRHIERLHQLKMFHLLKEIHLVKNLNQHGHYIHYESNINLKNYIKSDIDVILKDRPFWNSPKNMVECHLNLKRYKNLRRFISPWNLTTTQKLNFDIDSESWNNIDMFHWLKTLPQCWHLAVGIGFFKACKMIWKHFVCSIQG